MKWAKSCPTGRQLIVGRVTKVENGKFNVKEDRDFMVCSIPVSGLPAGVDEPEVGQRVSFTCTVNHPPGVDLPHLGFPDEKQFPDFKVGEVIARAEAKVEAAPESNATAAQLLEDVADTKRINLHLVLAINDIKPLLGRIAAAVEKLAADRDELGKLLSAKPKAKVRTVTEVPSPAKDLVDDIMKDLGT